MVSPSATATSLSQVQSPTKMTTQSPAIANNSPSLASMTVIKPEPQEPIQNDVIFIDNIKKQVFFNFKHFVILTKKSNLFY